MSTRPPISLIAAMDNQRIIGHHGHLPWNLPADLQYFKQQTLGKPIVMGRKTHESIGHALAGRQNIILSHNPQLRIKDCNVVSSLEQVWELTTLAPEVMIIGGATLYAQTLAWATRLYITHIHYDFPGDTVFPDFKQQDWTLLSQQDYPADTKNPHARSVCIWTRPSPTR